MTDQERSDIVAALERNAERARTLVKLYEDAAETVAGFRTEAEYQSLAAEAFETEQEMVDAFSSCRYDVEIEQARESVR